MNKEQGIYSYIGPPGSGKTTHLANKVHEFTQWSQKHRPQSWQSDIMICSLTKAAAAEIASRTPELSARQVGTLHSHAFRALGSPDIAEAHTDDFNRQHRPYAISSAHSSVDDPKWDSETCQRGNNLAQLYSLYRARKTPKPWPTKLQAFADAWEQWKQDAGLLDFADLIDTAFNETTCAPGAPSIILIDEAQDLSRAEHDLAVAKWGRSAGHVILVGDPDQSIYGWRGAEAEELYSDKIPSEHRRVLSQSYRVPRAVHAMAMLWRQKLRNPHPLEYKPRDADGKVTRCGSSYRLPNAAIQLAEKRLDEGKSVMFIGTCGYIMVPTLHELRKRAIPFSNPWRRQRGDWNPLAPKRGASMVDRIIALLSILPSEANRMWTWDEVERWSAPLEAKLIFQPRLRAEFDRLAAETPDEQTSWEQLKELMQPTALHNFVSHLGRTIEPDCDVQAVVCDMLSWWRDKLSAKKIKVTDYPLVVIKKRGLDAVRQEPKLFVGTAHSFKGSEADCVIVYPDLSPAGMKEWSVSTARDSVVRLFYVALTRAREEVIVCQPCGASAPIASVMEN